MASFLVEGRADNGRPRPPILRMPRELVDHVFEHLPQRDCKSLRQTCRYFVASATPVLFRSVCLSKTKRDQDSFFNIARSPYLAGLVRELVWYELDEDETTFWLLEEELDEAQLPSGLRGEDDNSPIRLPPFQELTHKALAIPTTRRSTKFLQAHPHYTVDDKESFHEAVMSILEEFQTRLLPALDSMPNIHTFVACPMPSEHIVSNEGYAITAQLLRQGTFRYDHGPSILDDGFGSLLARALSRPQSTVKRLTFTGVGIADSVSCYPTSLTHVGLRLGGHASTEVTNRGFANMGRWLRGSAKGLQDLRICFEEGISRQQFDLLEFLGAGLDFGDISWPHLQRLELSHVVPRFWASGTRLPHKKPMDRLLDTLRRYTPTLRSLVFRHCFIPARAFEHMSCRAGLQLESLEIEEYASKDDRIVDTAELLAYVHGTGPLPAAFKKAGRSIVCTRSLVETAGPQLEVVRCKMRPSEHGYANNYDGTMYSDEQMDAVHDLVVKAQGSDTPGKTKDEAGFLKVWLGHDIPGLGGLMERELAGDFRDAWTIHGLFIHPDGRRAIGCEPLETFSDWEDDSDDYTADESDDEENLDSQAGFEDQCEQNSSCDEEDNDEEDQE